MTPDSAVSKKNGKKILFGVLAVGLVALLSIIMTWAYLRNKTDEKTHTFTLGQGVDILLTQAEDVDIKIIPGKEYPQLKAMVSIPASAMEKDEEQWCAATAAKRGTIAHGDENCFHADA